MAEAGGVGGGVSSTVHDADGSTTNAYVEIFEDVASALLGIGTIKNLGAVAATGEITFPVALSVPTGVTFILDDGANPATTFEFTRGGMPAPGNVAVDISVAVTADDVRDAAIMAVNGAPLLAITASTGSGGGSVSTMELVNDATGTAGNVGITLMPPMTGSGMSGGTDGGNDLTVKETVTDRFGVTAFTETVVSSGAANDYLLNPGTFFDTARPPYVSYKVEVKSTIPGSPTGYSLRSDTQGET